MGLRVFRSSSWILGIPTELFKMKKIFNIDEKFAGKSSFSFIERIHKEYGEAVISYNCTIRVVREQGNEEESPRSAYTWIKGEGADYQEEPQTIKRWLLGFGTPMSDITEDKMDLELRSDEKELYQGIKLKTGTYSAKMQLFNLIPQLLLIDGKKDQNLSLRNLKTLHQVLQPSSLSTSMHQQPG